MSKKEKKNSGKISYIFTRETLGMTLMLFSAIVLLMLCSGSTVFAGVGQAICTLLYGTFGFGSFFLVALLAYLGFWLVFEKSFHISLRKSLTVSFTVFALFLLFHAVTTRDYVLESYGKYISDCYFNADKGFVGYTFGGVVSALLVYPVAKVGGFVTAFVLFSILVLPLGYLTVSAFMREGLFSRKSISQGQTVEEQQPQPESVAQQQEYYTRQVPENNTVPQPEPVRTHPVTKQNAKINDDDNKFSKDNLGRKILFEKGEFAAESYRRNMIFNEDSYFHHPTTSEADYLSSFTSNASKENNPQQKTYSEKYQESVYNQQPSMPSNYVYGEKPVSELKDYTAANTYSNNFSEQQNNCFNNQEINVTKPEPVNPYPVEERYPRVEENVASQPEPEVEQDKPQSVFENLPEHRDSFVRPEERGSVGFTDTRPEIPETRKDDNKKENVFDFLNTQPVDRAVIRRERSNSELFDDEEMSKDEDTVDEDIFGRRRTPIQPEPQPERPIIRREPTKPVEPVAKQREEVKPDCATSENSEQKPKHIWKKYIRPSLDLLDNYPDNANVNTAEIEDNKQIIVETLARFKIASEVSNVTIGPAITRYDVIIEDKTNIKRSLGYRDAIAMELRKDNVNAYLNYSKGALSIEVPNNNRAIVGLKTMLASQKFINSKSSSLTFALGKNVEGEIVCPDITKMPHLLVAGTTGSGKSICLSALLVSLLYKYGPEDLRLILVDPKQVEFISYDKLPHLMINEIIYDCDKAIKALNWAIKEMERRYSLFKEMTEAGIATKNLDEYNENITGDEEKLAKIVIVLDEFGDLMLQAKKDIESRIIKLVQKARACGIHLILATQRPSVDCITGLIKSNLPTRIGFKVNSFDDARTIFDIGGAEKLLGKGDSYFRSAESPDLARIQCCFVGSKEVQKVTDFVKANNETYFDQSVSDYINTVEQEEKATSIVGGDDENNETKIDDTFIKALKYCVTSNQASVSMLQRRFPVGYIKACKIIDWMENMTYITPSEGSKPRKVLLSKEEFFNIYGDVDD